MSNCPLSCSWPVDDGTGIADNWQLLRFLNAILPQAERNGSELAVLRVWLDFRGNQNAAPTDTVLRQLAGRIRGCIRSGDFLARVAGSEFIVILTAECPVGAVAAIASRIQASVRKPVRAEDGAVVSRCVIGITSTRDDLIEAGRILDNSAIALARAANAGAGSNATSFFSVRTQALIERQAAVSDELAGAIDDGAIIPWFQPQISLATGALTGLEALVRWNHPQRGILSPADFLDVAEQSGQIEKIGELVLRGSLLALRDWAAAGFEVPRVAVNLSAVQLNNPCLAGLVKWELDRLEVDPSRLTIEILETVLGTSATGIAARNLRELKSLGVRIDLDDFGTGNASVVNIRRFGVHRIKIDRSFIRGIDQDGEQQKITSAMITMAAALGVQVLAEGVETPGEERALQRLGCEFIQGYALARPMPASAVPGWLLARQGHRKSA